MRVIYSGRSMLKVTAIVAEYLVLEHEPLGALSVRRVRWSKALEVGVDDAQRSSAEEAPRQPGLLASCFPSGIPGLWASVAPERANRIYDPQADRLRGAAIRAEHK
jgi:hypothetical protein